jgi:hypothetical protein
MFTRNLLVIAAASVIAMSCGSSSPSDTGSAGHSGSGGSSAGGGGGASGGGAGEGGGGGTGAGGAAGVTGAAGAGAAGTSGAAGAAGGSGAGGTTGVAGSGGAAGGGSGGSATGGGGGAAGNGGRGGGGAGGVGGAAGGGGRGGTSGGAGTGGASGSGGRGGAGGGGGAAGGGGGAAGGGAGAGGSGGAAAYNPCPTNGDPCKVLPLGDSITFGINYEGSYRVELFKRSVTANQKITFVGTQTNGPAMAPGTTVPFPQHHEGHSGFTISMILGTASMDVQFAPHIILLHAGTNDTYMSDPTGAPSRLSSAVDSLASMFPTALIAVAKIIPYPSQASNVNLINQSIPAMVQAKVAAGKHVIMVDLNSGFQTSTMLSSDGIHPNQTGYNWMGDTWYAAVGSLFPG